MARLRGPENGSRLALRYGGLPAVLAPVVIYAAATGDALADVLDLVGNPLTNPTTDGYGLLPLFQYPDGTSVVYVSVDGGPRTEVYARDIAALTASAEVDTFVVLTQAAYTALATKDPRTVYLRTP